MSRYFTARLFVYLVAASILGGIVPLQGCAAFGISLGATKVSAIAETPQQKAFALQTEYAALLAVMLRYESLPRCPQLEGMVCSKPNVVKILRELDLTTFASIQTVKVLAGTAGILDPEFTAALAVAQGNLGLVEQQVLINQLRDIQTGGTL